MTQGRGKTALVLAGGGSLGAVQVGMLQALAQAGLIPDLVVGCSVGALNAAVYAGDPTPRGVATLAAIWRRLRRKDIFPLTLRSAVGLLGPSGALFDAGKLRRLVEGNLRYRNLEDSTIPLHVVATNFGGESVCLSTGPAVDAILASAAIPMVFPSVEVAGEHLMDGAVSGNTPILAAVELGATRLIILPTGFACALVGPPNGAVARGFHALTMIVAHQMVRDIGKIAGSVEVITAPSLCPLGVSPFDFTQTDALVNRAAHETEVWIASGGLSRQEIPAALHPHSH